MNRKFSLLFAGLVLASVLPGAPPKAQEVSVTYLYGSGTDAGDEFGWDTALGGGWLLVGARFDHYMDPQGYWLGGRVYAFHRDATGAWEEADLWLPEKIGGGGAFGDAVALTRDGRLALVGARGEGEIGCDFCMERGAAYVFRYDEGAGGEGAWTREARLAPEGLDDYAYAGQVVAVDGELAVMNGGWNGRSLVVFRHADGGEWEEEATFSTGTTADFFSVPGDENVAVMDDAVEGERVVGGAYWEDTGAGLEAGAVYVYRNDGPDGGPAAWVLEGRIEPSDAAPGRGFGNAVSLSPDGRLLLVGAYAFNGPAGRAYVYRREGDGASSMWVEEAVLTPGVGGYGFGSGAVLSVEPGTGKPLALVMYGGGDGELFRRETNQGEGSEWERVVAFRDTLLGHTASLDGATAAAGNFFDDTRGDRAGRAVVFDLSAFVSTAAEPPPAPPSEGLTLSAYPNPVRGRATLALTLPEVGDPARGAGAVRVGLYDALGRRVALVHDGPLAAGSHRLAVDVSGLAPGVYLARAEAATGVATTRLAVAR